MRPASAACYTITRHALVREPRDIQRYGHFYAPAHPVALIHYIPLSHPCCVLCRTGTNSQALYVVCTAIPGPSNRLPCERRALVAVVATHHRAGTFLMAFPAFAVVARPQIEDCYNVMYGREWHRQYHARECRGK